jgi:hypothetical protein
MRFDIYSVGAKLVRELEAAGAVRQVLHDGYDIIHLELMDGHEVMIYLVERVIPPYEIRTIINANTASGVYSMFIAWRAMLLPDDGQVIEPDGWMDALIAVGGDKIYGFETQMGQLMIYPVYFDALPYNSRGERRVRYGAPISVGNIRARAQPIARPGWDVTWRVADFETGQPAQESPITSTHPLARQYALLGLAPGADAQAVKRAYRRLAREVHPDLNLHTRATVNMQEVNAAYRAIMQAATAAAPDSQPRQTRPPVRRR